MKTHKATEWIQGATTLQEHPVIDTFAIGRQMKELRLANKKGLREVARAVGLSGCYIVDCERGFRKLNPEKLQEYIDACLAPEEKKEVA